MQKEVSESFQEGCKLKDKARKNLGNLSAYLDAAAQFEKAGKISHLLAQRDDLGDLDKGQHSAFGDYYFSEQYGCLSHYNYEMRQCEMALKEHHLSAEHLDRAISQIEKTITKAEEADSEAPVGLTDHLRRFLAIWQYYRQVDAVEVLSIEARAALDKKDLVAALDRYRRIVKMSEGLVEVASNPALDPAYERIAVGNLYGMLTNVSQVFAHICMNECAVWSGDSGHGYLTDDVARYFLDSMYEAYRTGQKAFRANPEWRHYVEDNQEIANVISQFLSMNKAGWVVFIERFKNEPDFLDIMKRTDIKAYNKAKEELAIAANPYVKLWQVGSFFMILMWAVGSLVVLIMWQSVHWWQPVVALIGIDALVVILGAFTLRTTGELSEENFRHLIELAFRQQFSLLTSVINSIKGGLPRSNKSTSSSPIRENAEGLDGSPPIPKGD